MGRKEKRRKERRSVGKSREVKFQSIVMKKGEKSRRKGRRKEEKKKKKKKIKKIKVRDEQ